MGVQNQHFRSNKLRQPSPFKESMSIMHNHDTELLRDERMIIYYRRYGPRQANLVLIACASSEGSGEPAHPQ